jgi:hypothetical protein
VLQATAMNKADATAPAMNRAFTAALVTTHGE